MADEEPSDIPEIEEPAPADDSTPDDPNPEAAAPAEPPDYAAVLRDAFGDDPDEEELETVAAGLTADRLRAMDPAGRAALRASIRKLDAYEAKIKADAEVAAKAAKDRDAKFTADSRALRQREQALLALARSDAAAVPGEAPVVDPFTPEGQAKLAEYHGRKAAAEGLAPLRQRAAEVDRQARWDAVVDKHADLRDAKVSEEFGAYVAKLNEGIDPTKERPRVPTEIAADLFFGERARVALEKQVADRKAREAADRASAARMLARSGSGGGTPDAVARYRALRKTDPDAAHALLERDPVVRQAVLGQAGIT